MLEILNNPFIVRAIIAIVLISFVSSAIGSLTIFREQSFLVAGIAHGALAGAALAIFLDYYRILPEMSPIAGATVFSVIMAVTVGFFSSRGSEAHMDVIIGITFSMAMSLAILFVSMIREYAVQAWGLIMGDLLLLTSMDLLFLIIISSITVFLVTLFYREFVLIAFDEEGARALGLKVLLYDYLLLILTALSTVVLLKGVGAILVYVMLIIPAAAANKLAKNASNVMILALLFSLISGFLGLILAIILDLAPSALAGLIATTIYVITLMIKRA